MGRGMGGWETGVVSALQVFVPLERELLVFAAFWFVIGLLDELAIDLAWLWFRLTGKISTLRLPQGYGRADLSGPVAVLVPTFQEAPVIGDTIRHMLAAWPQQALRLYIGCYCNDPATLAAAQAAAGSDGRVRLVVHGVAGPTTKADCLNRLYAALCADEQRSRQPFHGVVLHDAEDMVHPAALQAIDSALGQHDFVQLPVRPAEQPESRWVAGHYADEFAEAHAKGMVVRAALGAAIPAAGVGCGFARHALTALAARRRSEGSTGPFAPECLTEDYELGIMLSQQGRGSTFLRLRDASGRLVATGSYFPTRLGTAIRQKTRWIHGIAFQAWDRMGWAASPIELWMALRDRRGPLTALVLSVAYLLLLVDGLFLLVEWAGGPVRPATSTPVHALLVVNVYGFAWRTVSRAAFTAREYGLREGLRAVLRIPVANVIAIMSGRRALVAYWRSLRGGAVVWDKTEHASHPSLARLIGAKA
ncbi:MAG: hypothetical protein RIQ99_1788 [Pseudomonadota bacterium]